MVNSRRPERSRYWIGLILWTAALTTLSLMPLPIKRAVGTTGQWHNVGHLIAFAITVVLFLQCRRPGGYSFCQLWPVVALAFALEWLESVLYRSIFEWKDVSVDALGIALGLLIFRLWSSQVRPASR
jgi:uncharacterized membrane protein YhaH (DUF805 family)